MTVSLGSRVSDRFGGPRNHSGSCLIWVPDRNNELGSNLPMNKIKPKFEWVFSLLERINCSVKEGKFPKDMFFHYPNGSYTGPIGMIQRNEVTTMTYVVRPDSLPFNPGLIGPVLMPADVAIGYFKHGPIQTTTDMTSFVTDFPGIVYAYVLIGLFIFCVCFIITEGREVDFPKRFGAKNLMSVCEKTAYTLVDQGTLDAETTSGRITLTNLHVMVMFFIYGLFLSKLGADLVVLRDTYRIDSIEELIQNNSITKPIITKQFFLLDLLKQAYVHRPNSTLGRMFEVIHSDLEHFTYDLQPSLSLEILLQRFWALLNRMKSKEVAYVMPHKMFPIFNRALCLVFPHHISRIKLAKETFAHGMLTLLMSRNIDPMVRKKLEYYFETAMETSLITSTQSGFSDTVSILNPRPIDAAALQCQDLHQENAPRISFGDEDTDMWRTFNLYDYSSLLVIMACIITVAIVILVLEIFVNLVCKLMKRRRRLCRRRFKKANKRVLPPGKICKIVAEQVALDNVKHRVIHLPRRRRSL